MQDETLKINYEEMLEKDNMDLEKWYESKVFSEKKKKAKVIITVLCHVVLLYIHG